MNDLIRQIYSLAEFDAIHDEDEKENVFGYLEESAYDEMREERNIRG